MPADFATVAIAMSASTAGEHYRTSKHKAAGWMASMPADWQAKRKANMAATKAHGRPRLTMPTGFADYAQPHTIAALTRRYDVSVDTIRIWLRAQSPEWTSERVEMMNQRKAGVKHPRRQSKPAAPSFAGQVPLATDSLASRAADHLKRVTRIQPIADAGKVYGTMFNGLYLVGRLKMPVADMIALAMSKGYDPDAWKRVA